MSTASSAEALLVEHLRYTPLSLIDDVINTINAIVYRAITAIETGLLSTPPAALGFDQPSVPADSSDAPAHDGDDDPKERQRAEVEEGVHRLETLLEATVDKTFDKFEIYTLRNILHVPADIAEWVRLRHYEGLDFPPKDGAATASSITEMRRRLQATQQLNLTLSHTHTSNELLLGQLRSVLSSPDGHLSYLQNTSSTPLQPSAQFSKSQLPALRSLLQGLRPRINALSELSETGARSEGDSGIRDERAKYMEGVVDRVVSTQLGATREADDELGQHRAEEEVRSMEKIASERVADVTRQQRRHVQQVDQDEMEE